MEAAQRPPTKQIWMYDMEQPRSTQTEPSPAVKSAKKKRVQQKFSVAPSQAVQQKQEFLKEAKRIEQNGTPKEKRLTRAKLSTILSHAQKT